MRKGMGGGGGGRHRGGARQREAAIDTDRLTDRHAGTQEVRLSLSISLSLSHTHTLSHTNTLTQTHTPFHTQPYTLQPLPLHLHTFTQTHTPTHSISHLHPPTPPTTTRLWMTQSGPTQRGTRAGESAKYRAKSCVRASKCVERDSEFNVIQTRTNSRGRIPKTWLLRRGKAGGPSRLSPPNQVTR